MKLSSQAITILKWLTLILALAYIVYKINFFINQDLLSEVSIDALSINYIPAFLVILLVGFNWGLEALKWRRLVKPIEEISFIKAYKGVIAGISTSIFTPNRVGEFAGRMLVLKKENRLPSVLATLLGGFIQLLVTLIAGTFAIGYYHSVYATTINNYFTANQLFLLLFVVISLGFFVYLLFPRIGSLIVGKFKGKVSDTLKFTTSYSANNLGLIFLIAVIRYLVFSFQYVLMLYVFNIPIPIVTAFYAVFLAYFIMTFLPTFALSEIGVRSSVALFVFSAYTSYSVEILMASVVLWIVNLAIPALFGLRFIYKFKE